MQRVDRHGEVLGAQAHRGGVDDEGRGPRGPRPFGPGHGGPSGELGRRRGRIGFAGAHHDAGAGAAEGPSHRARRAAPAEHDDRGTGRIVTRVPKRSQEALTVGRIADETALGAGRDGVHATQRGRVRRELVATRRRGELVRHRHREPGQAERAHRVERGARRAVGHFEGDVHPVETELAIRGVVQHRRQGVPYRIADDARDARGPRDRHRQNAPFAFAMAILAFCSSGVVANAVLPFLSMTT